MTDETATGAFDLDSALESAYDKVTNPDAGEAQDAAPSDVTEIAGGEEPSADDNADQGNAAEGEPAEKQPLTAPERWSAEWKAKFSILPREAQEVLLSRESEIDKAFTQKTQELSEQRKQYEALEQVLAPRRQALASAYGSEANAINQLLQISDYADRDPAGFVQWFAQQRGINLQNAQTVADSDAYVDPVTQQLTQRLSSIEQTLTTQQQLQAEARRETARGEIAAFKEEKGEDGNLLYPYFEEVKSEMGSLMLAGTAKNLKHAYEMAQWANGSVRQKILEAKAKADEAQRLEATKQAASKAEKAKGVTVRSKKAGDSAPSKKSNWEDTLNEVAGELYGAA